MNTFLVEETNVCKVFLAETNAADIAAALEDLAYDVLGAVLRETPHEDGAAARRSLPC